MEKKRDCTAKKEHQKRRQELPKLYTLNGAIYICKTKYIDNLDFYSDKSFAYIMDKKSSIDIDEELDLRYAEFILNNNFKEKSL